MKNKILIAFVLLATSVLSTHPKKKDDMKFKDKMHVSEMHMKKSKNMKKSDMHHGKKMKNMDSDAHKNKKMKCSCCSACGKK